MLNVGQAYVAACASLLGAEAEGLDFSQSMVDEARSQFPHIPFEVGDVEELPSPDQYFDAVLNNIVLFMSPTPPKRCPKLFGY